MLPLYQWSPPVNQAFAVTPRTLEYTSVDKDGNKYTADRRYESFRCPPFKGNPGHLEWWHFQARAVGKMVINSMTGVTWMELAKSIGLGEDLVREIYGGEALTTKAALTD